MMPFLNKNWSSLIKPTKIVCESTDDNPNSAKIVAEPFERGFGLTIGNALRRILLSSLRGAAITSLKISGVPHQFSSIPGVKEDLVDVILNLKFVSLRMNSPEKKRLNLKAEGPCVVTAGMIETDSSVEILNPELVVCTLAKDSSLNMELTCETGKGYVPSYKNQDTSVGVIPIDALFSPVKKVAYEVQNTRVGQVTDYDKLVMTVETDGSLTPDTAVALAARILQDQLSFFINFEEEEYSESQEKSDELPFNPLLFKKIEVLELSVRSANCFSNGNVVYIGDLVQMDEGTLLRMSNFGRKSLNEVKAALGKHGLKLNMEIQGWPPEDLEALSKKYDGL